MRRAGATARSAARKRTARYGKTLGRRSAPLPVSRARSLGKTRVTIYFDDAVVEFFKRRAGKRGYQTLINEALRAAIDRQNLEDALRKVVREEVAPYLPRRR
ncbi:MAG: BrnA antitoxin family protein [Burkholderiales bacterium]|nr:BrnA antitoxin family protein [Burkholderiales bacterium]